MRGCRLLKREQLMPSVRGAYSLTAFYVTASERFPSAHKSLQPFSKLSEFKLARSFRAIKGIAHDNVTQFGRGIDVAVHSVEQVEKSFKVVVGISCWTRTEDLEQALAFCRRQPMSI